MEEGESKARSKAWKVQRMGSGTFVISKPKRNRRKLRQARLRNRLRAR